jgi:hypothetical protein
VLYDSTGNVVLIMAKPPEVKRRARGPGLTGQRGPQPTPPPQEGLHRNAKRARLAP